MLDLIPRSRLLPRFTTAPALPTCPIHPGSLVRRYRGQGENGPGAYPQCVPGGSEQPHLLSWEQAGELAAAPTDHPDTPGLSHSESGVLDDAADGMTVEETAVSRSKSSETVKTQRRSILLKLGAKNMTHAVALVSTRKRRVDAAE